MPGRMPGIGGSLHRAVMFPQAGRSDRLDAVSRYWCLAIAKIYGGCDKNGNVTFGDPALPVRNRSDLREVIPEHSPGPDHLRRDPVGMPDEPVQHRIDLIRHILESLVTRPHHLADHHLRAELAQ